MVQSRTLARIAQFQFFLNLVLSGKLMGRVCRFLWELKGGQQAFGTLALNKVIIQFSNESNHVIRENERIAQFSSEGCSIFDLCF